MGSRVRAVSPRARGKCRKCGGDYALTKEGVVRSHQSLQLRPGQIDGRDVQVWVHRECPGTWLVPA